ncbi:MAG TPA: hypothetical protein VN580_03190 [Clostridia bacterium]|nr:hypothetical protein [Clostridia bacterium]
MLLREFAVENHTISLMQEDELYIAKVTNNNGEKILYHEYKDYEKIKSRFDEIVQAIETDNIGIKAVIGILERNPA